ncbi:MAG: SAM-dependent methyltransferase [Chthoniobacterales bacterium]
MRARGQAILNLLKRLQDANQNVRWDRFMQAALYDPELGYYSKNISGIGHRGDFTTFATLNDMLARTIAHWGCRERKKLSKRLPWLEAGSGDGSLAKAVLGSTPLIRRFFTLFLLVEVSPVLRKLQQSKLRWHNARWFSSPLEAAKASPQGSLFFSNELVDAFPCRIFRRCESGWEELFLKFSENGLGECFLPVGKNELPESSVFDGEISKNRQPGQRVEVHESYKIWLENFMPAWHGSMLTIDYGGPPKKIYHRRPDGTLRAYWKQERFVGSECYARFGLQDLTADVNFQDINKWMSQQGAELVWEGTLLEFTKYIFKKNLLPSEFQEAAEAFYVTWHRKGHALKPAFR